MECCGDDDAEFLVGNYCPGYSGPDRCCSSESDFIDKDGNCVEECPVCSYECCDDFDCNTYEYCDIHGDPTFNKCLPKCTTDSGAACDGHNVGWCLVSGRTDLYKETYGEDITEQGAGTDYCQEQFGDGYACYCGSECFGCCGEGEYELLECGTRQECVENYCIALSASYGCDSSYVDNGDDFTVSHLTHTQWYDLDKVSDTSAASRCDFSLDFAGQTAWISYSLEYSNLNEIDVIAYLDGQVVHRQVFSGSAQDYSSGEITLVSLTPSPDTHEFVMTLTWPHPSSYAYFRLFDVKINYDKQFYTESSCTQTSYYQWQADERVRACAANGDGTAAICDIDTDCVWNGACFSQEESTEVTGGKAFCAGPDWTDCDANEIPCESYCSETWAKAGESGVGEYPFGDTLDPNVCCGDDDAEYPVNDLCYSADPASQWYCCDNPNDCIDDNGNCVSGGCCDDENLGGGYCCLHDTDCCHYNSADPASGSICSESDPEEGIYGYCAGSNICDCQEYSVYDCNPWLGGCELTAVNFCCQTLEGTTGFYCGTIDPVEVGYNGSSKTTQQ